MSTVATATPTASRRQVRVPYVIEVTLSSEHNFWTGFTENLSEGGVFLATPREVPLGTQVLEVRWVRAANAVEQGSPPGLGVRFVNLDPELELEIGMFTRTDRDATFFDGEDA
jgi:hypothetical protein